MREKAASRRTNAVMAVSRIPAAQAKVDQILQNAEATKQERINEATGQVARFNKMYEEYVKTPSTTTVIKAFKDDLCAWFNAFGIKGVYSLSKNRCCVLLKNGRFIELNMSATLFKKRFHQALSIIGLLFVRFHQLEHEMTYTGQKVLYRLSEERLGYEVVTHKQGEGRFE